MLEGFDSRIKKIAVGAEHSLVLLNTEELYAFGNNIKGQCTGDYSLCLEPIKVEIPNNGNVYDIYCGYYHNLIVLCIHF
jgi:alpha-tubulin suppressor-like RCC1 family protein